MSAENIPRASIEVARHGGIDTELKNLKLFARRLQSVLTLQATERQILQRLYYKNKNQHRGALFWRNVIEVRRFLERIESLNLCDSINALRSKFYNTTQNLNSIKGSWSHCPDTNYLSNCSEQCTKALKLVAKTAERCLNAHRSFHRSMQSAAFLPILLMFVAISARTRTLVVELQEILEQTRSCTNRLSVLTGTNDVDVKGSLDFVIFNSPQAMELDTIDLPVIQNFNKPVPKQQESLCAKTTHSPRPSQFQSKVPPQGIIIERMNDKLPNKTQKESKQPKQDIIKKKKRVPRNEIDDIFGF